MQRAPTRTTRTLALPAFLAACLALAGCGSPPPPAVAAYADARLEPGAGLGDLRLGQTTLGQVLARLGPATVDLVVADYAGFELNYADRQLILLFNIDAGPCFAAARTQPLREVVADLPAFLAEVPACADLPLHSLAVRGGFWTGATDRGVHLGDGLWRSGGHGEPDTDGPAFVHAGLQGAPAIRLDYPSGISLFAEGMPGADGPPIRMIAIWRPDAR